MKVRGSLKKRAITIIITIFITSILVVIINFINIRNEFITYLNEQYTDIAFNVGMTKVDILYGSYYTKAKCNEDNTEFYIRKGFSDNKISEDYLYIKNLNKKNKESKEIFSGTEAEKYIYDVSGGNKLLDDDDKVYTNIYIRLISDIDAIHAIKDIFIILKEKNIKVEEVTFSFERDKGVYEALYLGDFYDLTEKEIEDRIIKIK